MQTGTDMNRKQVLKIDFHSHCLPEMDDGAADIETATAMLHLLAQQGIETVLLTPHYYASVESVDSFLERRERALQKLSAVPHLPKLIPGAEVHLERELAIEEVKQLCIGASDRLLLEMPFMPFAPWMAETAENCMYIGGCQLILAHLTRYLPYYSDGDLEQLISIPQVIVQINAEALLYRPSRKLVQKWLADGVPLVFGSDTHNITTRRPHFDKASRWLSRSHGGKIPAQEANRLANGLGFLK